jgi:hypothetical protein
VSLALLLTRPATLLRRSYTGAADEFGDPTYVEVTSDVVVEIQQAGTSEALEGQVMSASYRVFLPATEATLAGWDALDVDGERYELDGDPAPQYNPRLGAVSHVEALASRVR